MASSKKLTDSIRVKILKAMQNPKAIAPNIKYIKRITGFHRATIKSSINFMENSKFILGYRPILSAEAVGYKQRIWTFLQTELSNKTKLNEFIANIKKDPSVIYFSNVITDNNQNLAINYLTKDIESHYYNVQKRYYEATEQVFDFIKARTTYYLSNIIHERNDTDALISLLEKDLGID